MPSAFHGNRSAYTGGEPYLHYAVKNTPRLSVEGPGAKNARKSILLPHGTPLVLDYLSMGVGYARFKDGFDAVMAPYRSPPVQRPGPDYKEAIQLAVHLVGGHGLLRWTISSAFLMNHIKLLHEQFELYPEAVEKKQPLYIYTSDDPHEMGDWPGDTFYTTGLRIEDWMLRGRETFGPQTVREPVPLLGGTEPPVALPPVANDAAVPPSAPANDAPQAYRPVAAPTPPPAASQSAEPAAPAVNDLLAKYIRRQ